MPQANFTNVRILILLFGLLSFGSTASAQNPTNNRIIVEVADSREGSKGLKVDNDPNIADWIQVVFAGAMIFFTLMQYCIAKKTWKIQLATTRLAQLRLRLETYMRGSSVPVREQSLSPPDSKVEEREMVGRILRQICGDDAYGKTRGEVESLVKEWLSRERELDSL